ncbi:MAG: PLDc N-terminal domain-containing protein [Elusimicrobia bacterium]|nr:PLDc N-terminal domain-containing protein [Elusimicrobiota bacterium]
MFGIELKYFGILVGLFVLFTVLTQIFWLWMVADCFKNESDEYSQRGLWLAVLTIGNFLTALIYYYLRYKKRMAK